MTYTETKKIMRLLNLNFPNAFNHLTQQKDRDVLLQQWYRGFQSYPYVEVVNALSDYLSFGIETSTPSLGKIFGDLKQILVARQSLPQVDINASWSQVLRLSKCDYEQSRSNFYSLPVNVRKALGSPQTLVDIAYTNPNKNGVQKKEFSEKLRAILEEELLQYQAGHIDLKTIASQNGIYLLSKDSSLNFSRLVETENSFIPIQERKRRL